MASIRNPRINQAIESVNARVGVIQAVMAARNSQISVANNLIDRGLNAITADKKDQLSYYNTLLQLNNDKLLNLSNESKTLANAQITQLENSLNRVNESADYLKKLMITPESATYIANAGVTLNDTVGEINTKLAAYGNQQEVTKMANEFTSNGYKQTPIKTNNSIEVSVGGKTLYFIPPTGYDMTGNKIATTLFLVFIIIRITPILTLTINCFTHSTSPNHLVKIFNTTSCCVLKLTHLNS